MPDSLSQRWFTLTGLLLVILAILAIYFYCQQPGYPWGGDSALYIMHARNIATGRPYAKTPYVYDDEAWMEGTPTFPPGLPLLLAPVYAEFGLNLEMLRDYCLILLVIAMIPIFLYLRHWLPPWLALLALFFTAINRLTLSLINNVGSEQPYMLFSFITLCVVIWVYASRRNATQPWTWGLAVGLLAAYTDFTRPIGISLLAGIALYDLYRNRRITRFLVTAVVVFVALVAIEATLIKSEAAYIHSQFRFNPIHDLVTAKDYVIDSFELWEGMPGKRWPRVFLCLATGLVALYGWAVKLRREGPGPADFYVVCYLGVLYFYWIANSRYLIPVLPIYMLYFFIGAQALWAHIKPQPLLRYAVAALVLLMGVTVARWASRLDRQPMKDGVETPTYEATVDYIRQDTPPQARVVSDSARFLALFTGRNSLYYPVQEDPAQIAAFFRRMHADYVLIAKQHDEDRDKLEPALALGRWQLVFHNSDYDLYRAINQPAQAF